MHNTKLGWKLDIKYASSKDVLSKFEVGRGGQGEMGLQEDDENDFDPFACFFNNNQETTVSNDTNSIVSDDIATIM